MTFYATEPHPCIVCLGTRLLVIEDDGGQWGDQTEFAVMKTILIGLAALTLASGAAMAAPGYGYGHGHGNRSGHGITPNERVVIARSAAHVATVKRMAMRDGRITPAERIQIRQAERQHAMLIARFYRS